MGVVQGLIASFSSSLPSLSDSDAQAFVTAAGITDTTQKNAVNQLVIDYKTAGVWTKCIAIYPFIGGTSSTHSYNLKNPATFQITWTGSVTHNSNGITGNGTNAYGNTGIIPSTSFTLNSTHYSIYSRTNNSTTQVDFGGGDGTNYLYCNLGNTGSCTIYMNSSSSTSTTIANTTGGFLFNRSASNAIQVYRNGSSVFTDSLVSSSLPSTYPMYILAQNDEGVVGGRSSKNLSLVTAGTSLNSTEAANKYTADQTFQTALGRNV